MMDALATTSIAIVIDFFLTKVEFVSTSMNVL